MGKVLSHYTRALRLRCPGCGGGPVFVSWLRMCPSCPSCGLRYDREPQGGYWVGSNTINLFATEAVFAVVFTGSLFLTWPDPPWDLITWGDVALMVLFPVFFFPYSKTLFIAVDLTFRPREPGDFEQPQEPAARPTGRRT
jgi:uncharacterized protein (DUF983 family)